MDILSELLDGPLAKSPVNASSWKAQWQASGGALGPRALTGGFASERPAWAFAWGYQCALHRLVPSLDGVAALAISEGRDTRPKTIACTAQDGRLRGRKSYVFLGDQADWVLVLAKGGQAHGRPVLKLYPLASTAEGLLHKALRPTPFVPEVPHSSVELDLPCPPPLPGDGWSDYSKPFRTLEDLFVTLAMLGHGLRISRQAGLDAELESLLPHALALLALSEQDPGLPSLHRALDPCLKQALALLSSLPWARHSAESAARWTRDSMLFALGGPARELRIQRARQHGR